MIRWVYVLKSAHLQTGQSTKWMNASKDQRNLPPLLHLCLVFHNSYWFPRTLILRRLPLNVTVEGLRSCAYAFSLNKALGLGTSKTYYILVFYDICQNHALWINATLTFGKYGNDPLMIQSTQIVMERKRTKWLNLTRGKNIGKNTMRRRAFIFTVGKWLWEHICTILSTWTITL